MKTTQLLPRLVLTCLLALPATFVFGQAPASIVGKKLILKSATNDYLTLAPVSSDTVWHYTREYDSEYGLWESSTYTWQSAGDTATVQMFFGALNLTFTSPSAGTFTNPFSSGTFEMSEDPADSSPPFDKYFSDDFTDLEKSNSIWPFRHSQSENGIVAKQANGTFTLTGTANIGHRWFYNGQQASLLSLAKDWIVSGASFARGTAPSAAKIAIQTSGNPPGGYVEVAIGASNRPPSVAGSAHWYAEVPWESFSGNGVPGGGTDGVYRIRHAASEKTFHCESHDGTFRVLVTTFNWHTGAYALLGDLPSGITSRNGQVDSWVSLEGQYVQPVMSFYLPSGSNVADDQLGFSGFSVTGEGDEPGLPETPETPETPQNNPAPVSATIEIISELVNFHEAIDNDTGSEIDFSNVQLTRYDLASTELGFTGDLSIGPGVPDGVFTGTVDYSDTESLDGNGNGISDFFEKELAASVIVNGSATWRAGSYYINYDLSNSSFTKAAGGYDFVLTRAYVKQSTNIPSAFGLNQDGFDFVTPVTPAQAKGSFVYGQGGGSYETDLELKGSLLSGTVEAAGAMSVNSTDSVTLNDLHFPSLGDSRLAGLNPLFGQDTFTDSITLTRQGDVYHAQKRIRGILYYVKLSGIPDSDGDGIPDLSGNASPPQQVNVATAASPASGGTVMGGGQVASGSTVTLTATPSEGYRFTGWSGDATGAANPLTITVEEDKSVSAVFEEMQYQVSVDATAGGTVTGGGQVKHGSTVTLTATPSGGYRFTGWSGDATGAANPLTITVETITTVSAVFEKVPSALDNAGTDRGNGWREADWFGFYFPSSSGWHYHAEHGWIYPVGETLDSIWFWDLDLGWCWTSRTVYPYVYRHDPEGWLRYLRESKNPRRFYDFAANAWTFTIPDLSLEMLWVEPGTFTMGSPESEEGRWWGEDQHEVTLTEGFWLGKYEVTQAQWEKMMGSNPSYFNGANRPVEQVSWNDVTSFCEKLTEQESEAGRLPAGMAYQLPTEAQWEYACRAGTTTAYSFGAELTSDQANIYGGLRKTTDVGKYPANAWGFHDMHGNVLEWCADRYGGYPTGAATDPVGPADGSSRVLRGGSWLSSANLARSAFRHWPVPAFSTDSLGFRLSLRPAGK